MAARVNRGEIWRLNLPHYTTPAGFGVTSSLIPLLHTVTVAAVTSTLRGPHSEVSIGVDEA